MQPILITRISGQLDKQFNGLVDMSDWATRPSSDARACFLSRALAAQCIKSLAGTDPRTAAASVTDGYHDNGPVTSIGRRNTLPCWTEVKCHATTNQAPVLHGHRERRDLGPMA
jgi:hypothetical protein